MIGLTQGLPFRQLQGPELAEGQPTLAALFPRVLMIKTPQQIASRALASRD